MNAELVSVIVPAYNAEQYIKQALDSILAQTWRAFEIIVVDDGSTDDTPRIVRQFGNTVRYIYQSNRGLAAARNTGIRNSQAEIIALLDADDLWEPMFLEKMMSRLGQCPDAAAAYCGFGYINTYGHEVGKPSLKVVPSEEFHQVLISDGNWLSACSVIFRRRLAEGVGLFDESLHAVEDEDLWIRLSARWPFVGLPEALVKYRRHDSNMSNDPERMVNAILQMREKYFGPAEGDVNTWSSWKCTAYANSFQLAAIRYLGADQIKKSADFIEHLAGISCSHVCSMQLWRALARSHVPETQQFEPGIQLDWTATQTHVMALLDELARRALSSEILKRHYSRIKSSAFLAMADEAGRTKNFIWTIRWICRAVMTDPRIISTRPYWGTIARSLLPTST